MDSRRGRRFPWDRSRSANDGSSSDRPPEYVHPLDAETGGDEPVWERAAADPFEPPQTTRLVPVGPSRPTDRSENGPDWRDDEMEPTAGDLDDADAPTFAADTMRALIREPDERPSFVGHTIGRPDFAAPQAADRPAPRPPASMGDQRVGPTPPADLFAPLADEPAPGQGRGEQPAPVASNPPPAWASTASARGVGASQISSAEPPAPAEVVVRIELVVIDRTARAAATAEMAGATETVMPEVGEADATAPDAAAPDAAASEPAAREAPGVVAARAPASVTASKRPARLSAPVRAAVRIVGVLALVGIGLFLVQLGAWLAR